MINPYDPDGENGNVGELIGSLLQLLPEPLFSLVKFAILGAIGLLLAYLAFIVVFTLFPSAKRLVAAVWTAKSRIFSRS